MDWVSIGGRIRKQREYLGLTREQLAEKLDITPKFRHRTRRQGHVRADAVPHCDDSQPVHRLHPVRQTGEKGKAVGVQGALPYGRKRCAQPASVSGKRAESRHQSDEP